MTLYSTIGEGNGNPLQYSCLENPRDRGAWWAAVYGVAQSRTRLKRLSSSNTQQLDVEFQRVSGGLRQDGLYLIFLCNVPSASPRSNEEPKFSYHLMGRWMDGWGDR